MDVKKLERRVLMRMELQRLGFPEADIVRIINALESKPEEDPEAWREEYRKKQAAGVKFENYDGNHWWGMWCMFEGNKEDYREVKPTIPHLAERKLWLAQREAGTNEVWQYSINKGSTWDAFPVDDEPSWCKSVMYRVKPKTVKMYMALLQYKTHPPFSYVTDSREEINEYVKTGGLTIIGSIEEREVEID